MIFKASRFRCEMDSKLASLSQKLLKCSNQSSPGLSFDPSNPADTVDLKWTKLIEDRYKHMLDGLQARIDEQLKVLHVRLQQVEDAQNELRAKLDMEQFGFRKLCSEVAQDVSSKMIQPDDRKQPKPWQTNQLSQRPADDHLETNHALILQKMNSIKYKISAEISLLKRQWQDDIQRVSSQCRDIEDKVSSVGKRTNDDKLELEGVLSAEIKTRRTHEANMHNHIKRIEERLEGVSGSLRNSLNELQISLCAARPTVRAEADRLNKSRENLHKTMETKYDELKRQFALLHNEMVNVQMRIPQQMNVETISGEQTSGIREVAESLLAVKLALAMKIKSLELKEQSGQDKLQMEIENLRNLMQSFLAK
ncbi:hypothetical protein CRM22_003923 [Opisthorchis felineus]|uniref:Uncharacterized protein n=1 Tax=Opisthorchis felineus TaxID=147828 RepID=A0A4V3SFN5_OPIFE|nr:hypothetical protein CRM22_003923 [Opisthorchis felineus]